MRQLKQTASFLRVMAEAIDASLPPPPAAKSAFRIAFKADAVSPTARKRRAVDTTYQTRQAWCEVRTD